MCTLQDFDGQRKAEKIFQTVILVFAGIGLAWGYSVERFSITVFTLTAGFVLAALVSLTSNKFLRNIYQSNFQHMLLQITLPPWPMYRRKPLNWQKPREVPSDSSSATPSTTKKKK